jgi:hypothetical protein
MQLSNGLTDPVGLWLGHLLFDTISVVIISTIITIVFAAVASSNFYGLGFFVSPKSLNTGRLWLILVVVAGHGPIRNHWSAICLLCIPLHGISTFCVRFGSWVSVYHLHCMSSSPCRVVIRAEWLPALPLRIPPSSHLWRDLDSSTKHYHHSFYCLSHRPRLQCGKCQFAGQTVLETDVPFRHEQRWYQSTSSSFYVMVVPWSLLPRWVTSCDMAAPSST